MAYKNTSRAYLNRAKQHLDSEAHESLFYAAFELRCGIESRSAEYLEPYDHVPNSVKETWRFAHLRRGMEKAFEIGDKIARLAILERGGKERAVFYFTPVTSELLKRGERIGEYLHALKTTPNENWWQETRKFLDETSQQLRVATTGTLLGPPLLQPATKDMSVHIEIPDGYPPVNPVELVGQIGEDVVADIRYLDELP